MALDVICIGEALVDFLPDRAGRRVREVERWHRCSGGSPANVAVGLARLGAKSGMLGVVGEDEFGVFLQESLSREGVDVSRLRRTALGKTGLVFISLTETGERSFSFHRTQAAEYFLGEEDVDLPYVLSARAIHLGTNSLLMPEARAAVLKMARAAKEGGRLVSADPNLRLHLWRDPAELKALLGELLPLCTLVKLSDEEIEFAAGTKDIPRALEHLAALGVTLPVVTAGPRGASFLWKGTLRSVSAPAARVVDTTGAGDGFVSGLLKGLVTRCADARQLLELTGDELAALAGFGCVIGSRVVQQLGAVASLPRWEEVQSEYPS